MEYAYSKELGKVLDAEQAYYHYQRGTITDKQAFTCTDCEAAVTSVNLDKPRQEMKRGVHFRIVGTHVSGCPQASETRSSQKEEGSTLGQSPLSARKIVFDTDPPPSPAPDREKKPRRPKAEIVRTWREGGGELRPRKYRNIAPLVSELGVLRQAKANLADHYVYLKNHPFPFSTFFCEIKGQAYASLYEYPRIYYGRAFVNQIPNGDFQIRFAESLVVEGVPIRPSLYLPVKELAGSHKRWLVKQLAAFADDTAPNTVAFIYGKPQPAGPYLNFRVSNYHFLELREVK